MGTPCPGAPRRGCRAEGVPGGFSGPLPLIPRLYHVWARVLRAPSFAEELGWQPVAAFAVRAEERGVHQTHALDGSDLPLLDLPTRWSVSPLRSALRAPGGGSR